MIESKINIIGAGLAGMSAALELAGMQLPCRLISLQDSERAQSVLAEGGINAALDLMQEQDDPLQHYEDTMKGGVWLADPNAVMDMVREAPDIVCRLRRLGVPFQMEEGRMIQRNFGGQKKKRTAYAKSSTGKILVTALTEETRRQEAAGYIERFPHHAFLRLEIADRSPSDRHCTGVFIRDRYTEEITFCPGPVLLCFGGFNGMFPGSTTGTAMNTGDALAMVYSQGVALANLEFIQYHPTTVRISGKSMLISEAARGEGGRLFTIRNGEKWYFMEEKYPELKNLMPRDVISREMALLSGDPDSSRGVFLDLTGLSRKVWIHRLSDLREEIIHYLGLDPAVTPVPVRPGIHYFMGGVYVDRRHRTSLKGLYAAGECACQYHGANRLGGNSLLGALYGGKAAAQNCAGEYTGTTDSAADETAIEAALQEASQNAKEAPSPGFAGKLGEILLEGLGILRDGDSLRQACRKLDALSYITPADQRRIELARAMLCSALSREESRGAHWRTDYPERDDLHFQKTTVAFYRNGKTEIEFHPIPEKCCETAQG